MTDIMLFPRYIAAGARLTAPIAPIAHPMNQGVDGRSGFVSGTNGERLFVKTLSSDQARWVNFENAALMAGNAGKAGLSPRLLAYNSDAQSFLFEALSDEWRPSIVMDLRDEAIGAQVILATKSLHALPPLAPSAPTMAALKAAMITARVTPPEHFEAMQAEVAKIEQAFAAAGQECAPCHMENSLSNFMLGPKGAVKTVDFDRAANGDPLADLGALCNEYCRSEADIALAVEVYAGQASPALVARVKLHMILAAFTWGMWGKVSHFTTDQREIEYYKYGENQFVRCGYHIATWDVDQLIGEM